MANLQRDVTQLVGFCERTRVTEMAGCLFSGLDRYGPVLVNFFAAPFSLRWQRQFRLLAAVWSTTGRIAPFRTDPDHASLPAAQGCASRRRLGRWIAARQHLE